MKFRHLIASAMIIMMVAPVGISGLSVSAQDKDIEYENMVAGDMANILGTEGFVQIANSIEKPLVNTGDLKNARKYILDYIKSLEPYDVHWTGKNPKPLGEAIPYYTDDENGPIVYEWKIQCDDTKDCGSIIVATIDGVSRVMEASTYGLTNYERLGSDKTSQKNKLYYYSAFDQYIESTDEKGMSRVDTLDPRKQAQNNLSEQKSDLKNLKDEAIIARKTGALKFLEDAKNDAFSGLATASIAVNISNASIGNCGGPLPCYGQFTSTSYNGANGTPCQSGCGPTALAIIFGYYDMIGKFPKLVGNESVIASPINVDIGMVNSIRGYMGTQCSNTISRDGTREGETGFGSEVFGMKYARDRTYTNSPDGKYITGSVASMPIIMAEINAGRPVIVNYASTSGHIMAAYGYQSNPNMVHVNFGWAGLYPDKYIPVSLAVVTSSQAGNGNPVIGMRFHSVVTVPIQ